MDTREPHSPKISSPRRVRFFIPDENTAPTYGAKDFSGACTGNTSTNEQVDETERSRSADRDILVVEVPNAAEAQDDENPLSKVLLCMP